MLFKRIEDLRNEGNKTQKEIANMLGCSLEAYRRYERGEQNLPTKLLVKLAKYYVTNMDYILNITDETKPYPSKQEETIL